MRLAALALLAALAGPSLAQAQARTPETVPISGNRLVRSFQDHLNYADAVVAGDTIYLSGIVAVRRPGETGLEPAFERIFMRIGHVPERAGAGYRDIVEMTSYRTDMTRQVQRQLLGSPPPARKAIQFASLRSKEDPVEIWIVARRAVAAAAR